MKLEKIKVNSFKSILNQEIDINDNCIGFIGLNESGKSNILHAINMLDMKVNFEVKDKCKICKELPSIEFLLTLEDFQKNDVIASINSILNKNFSLEPEVELITDIIFKTINLKRELITEKNSYKTTTSISLIYKLNVTEDYLTLSDDHEIPNEEVITINEKQLKLNTLKTISKHLIPEKYKKYYKKIHTDVIKKNITETLESKILELVPNVEFWEYSSKFLIPAEITYTEFLKGSDPYDNNAPLYNMFLIPNDLEISDVDDLKQKVEEWKKDSSSRRKDEYILTDSINKHIKSIWEDYDQKLTIELEEKKITIHVSDPKNTKMNFYDMSVRSQGFKTFISFILTISAETKTGLLENYVLVLDEPETHLHPSGVKYMRNELLKLSAERNYIFFATHSIFMIDRANLSRHVIVQKEKEETELVNVTRNNILQEEVIYQALGTSRDEFSISSRNILFEGELDVMLFTFFLENCILKVNNKLTDYEFLDGGGTKRILKYFTDKSIPYDSKWMLILDNDAPGRNLPGKIEKVVLNADMTFIPYSKERDFELEDILPIRIITNSFIDAKEQIVDNEECPIEFSDKEAISNTVKKYYNQNRIDKAKQKKIEIHFKNNLESNLKNTLVKINKKSKKSEKFEKFRTELPKYFEFITYSLKTHFGMSFEE